MKRTGGWVCWLLLVLMLPVQAQTEVRYVHTDALGSVVAFTDENRNVVERREYEPYGAQLTPAVQDGPRYAGHVQDAATGLVYMQQRYYDPGIGRFLSVDPVTANASTGANFNRYWYANNNPYKFTDPDGREAGFAYNRDGSMHHFYMDNSADPAAAKVALALLPLAKGPAIVRAVATAIVRGRPDGVPKNWDKSSSNKGGGEKFRNPQNKHDEVRSMPGNPKSSNPAQQKPYVTRQADGKSYDAAGKEVPRSSPESHIPKNEFKYIPREELQKLNK